MVDMLGSADPSSTLGEDLTVREVLDTAAMTIETDLSDYPVVHAAVRMALSNTYLGLGKLEDALLHAQEMLRVSRESLGEGDPMTSDAMRTLAMIQIELGEYSKASELLEEALVFVDAMDDETESAKIRSAIAQVLHMQGHHEQSLEMWTRAESVLKEQLGENHKDTLIIMHNRGIALKDIGR